MPMVMGVLLLLSEVVLAVLIHLLPPHFQILLCLLPVVVRGVFLSALFRGRGQ